MARAVKAHLLGLIMLATLGGRGRSTAQHAALPGECGDTALPGECGDTALPGECGDTLARETPMSQARSGIPAPARVTVGGARL